MINFKNKLFKNQLKENRVAHAVWEELQTSYPTSLADQVPDVSHRFAPLGDNTVPQLPLAPRLV